MNYVNLAAKMNKKLTLLLISEMNYVILDLHHANAKDGGATVN